MGLEKDMDQAVKWIRMAAEKGDATAEYELGIYYLRGLGVDKDPSVAARWFQRSAEQGHVQAQNSIGYSLATGHGTETDLIEAYKWYSLAIAQNDPNAKVNLQKLLAQLAPEQIEEGNRRVAGFTPKSKPKTISAPLILAP
jgi:uncharacterized protein